MRGDVTSEALHEVDTGHYFIEAYAGEYTFEWDDGDRKQRMGIRFLAGEERTLHLADLVRDPAPEPIPTGLGRLRVRLLGSNREPMVSTKFWIVGRAIADEDVEAMRTDKAGQASMHLRPGDYIVRVGSAERRVSVPLEKEVECLIDHTAFGELRFPSGFPGRVVLFAGREAARPLYTASLFRRGVAFVPPGIYRYHLLFHGQRGDGWYGGEVRIEPGRIARIEPRVPTGTILVELEVEPNAKGVAHARIPVRLRLDAARHRVEVPLLLFPVRGERGRYHGSASRLPPGRWKLTIATDGYVAISRSVDVGDGPEKVRLRLDRSR